MTRPVDGGPRPAGGIDESSRSQLDGVARGGALNLAGAVASAAGSFGLVVLVANGFSERTAGMLFAASSAFLILAGVAALGTDTGLARFLLRLEAHDRTGDIPLVLRVSARPVAVTALGLALVLAASADVVAPALGLPGATGATMLRIVALALPLVATSDYALATTRAFGRMRPTVVVEGLVSTVVQVGAVALVAWRGGGPVALMGAWTLPYVVAATCAATLAVQLVRTRSAGWERPDPSRLPAVRREFWTYTWPRGLARLFQIALQRADIIVVAVLLDPGAAAVYTAATRFVVLGQFASQAIQRVLQPRFSHLLATGRTGTVADVFRVSTAWSMILSWPIYLAVACAAPLYLRLFGSGYEAEGVRVVVVMALAMMVAIASGPLDTLLLMSGRSLASMVNTGVALAVDLGLCLLLIPRIGITGAAVAWAVSVVVRNLLALVQVHGDLGVTPFSRAAGVVAAASVCCIAGPVLLVGATVGLSVVSVLGALAVGGAAFAGVLWWARRPLALSALRALVRRPAAGAAA